MNKKSERMLRLMDIIKVRHYVNIKELAALLGVSEMTVRRDIAQLEQDRTLENVNGNVVYSTAPTTPKNEAEYNLTTELEKQNAQKDEIGRFAASLIQPEDIVILDTGTTTEKIAQHIPQGLGISVLCYNINILMELWRKPGVQLLFSGGHYHQNTQMFECPEGIEFVKSIRAQKVFISAAGVHRTLGLTCVNSYEVPTKRAILASSLQHILVADSQKFDAVRPAYFCTLSDIDVIISDCGLSQEWQEHISSLGITLHLV